MFDFATSSVVSVLGGGLVNAGAVALLLAVGYMFVTRRTRHTRPETPSALLRTTDGHQVRVPLNTTRLGPETRLILGVVGAVCLIIAGLVMNGTI
jgi:hypothetical protein